MIKAYKHAAYEKKIAYQVLLAGLGLGTGYGAILKFWQFSNTSAQLDKAHKQFEQFLPVNIKGSNARIYPWISGNDINTWEYKMVTLKGYFRN